MHSRKSKRCGPSFSTRSRSGNNWWWAWIEPSGRGLVIGASRAQTNSDGISGQGTFLMDGAGKDFQLDVSQARGTVLPADLGSEVPAWFTRDWRCPGLGKWPFSPFPKLEPGDQPSAVFELDPVLVALVACAPAGVGAFAGSGEDQGRLGRGHGAGVTAWGRVGHFRAECGMQS